MLVELSFLRSIVLFCDLEVNGDQQQQEPATGGDSDDEDSQQFYNKSKSFFDNISCEATDRAQG